MAETYASKAEFDTLRQQIQSDPSAAFAAFRCMPQVVQRNHVAGGTPATFEFQQVWSYQGGGGILLPNRQIEAKLVVAASNGSGAHRWVQYELRLNTTVLADGDIGIQDNATYEGDLTYRLIARGSNTAQLLAGSARGTAAENLAAPWTLSLHVRGRDAMGIDFVIDPDTLTEPVLDTYYFVYHSLVILT